MWENISNPFSNVNGYTVRVWEWISKFHPTFNNAYSYQHGYSYHAGILIKTIFPGGGGGGGGGGVLIM